MKLSTRLLILVVALYVSGFTFLYFSWSGLSSNQTVSFDNANDGVTNGYFSARGTPPTGSKQITKSEALSNYWWWPYNSHLYPKSSNELVSKQDMTAGDVLSTSNNLYYNYTTHALMYGWTDPCSVGTTFNFTIWYQAPLAVNTKVFADQNYTPLSSYLSPVTGDWFQIGGVPVQLAEYYSAPEDYWYVSAIGHCITGNIGSYTSKQIRIILSTPAPISDFVYITGSYTDHSDGQSHTWHMDYNITSGVTSQSPQTPISDYTGTGLVTGDVLDVIDGGSPWAATIASGTVFLNLINSLP